MRIQKTLPVTDYAILGSLSEKRKVNHIRNFYLGKNPKSFKPVRETAGACFEEITDMFSLPPLTEEELGKRISLLSNSASRAENVACILALKKFSSENSIRFRKYPTLPLFRGGNPIRGLVRYVAADSFGPFFPIVEPRSPLAFSEEAWGLLASIHRLMCCHGDFRSARIGILKFLRPDKVSRVVKLVFDYDLPSFNEEQINAVMNEIDSIHNEVYQQLVKEGAFFKNKGRDDNPDFFRDQ